MIKVNCLEELNNLISSGRISSYEFIMYRDSEKSYKMLLIARKSFLREIGTDMYLDYINNECSNCYFLDKNGCYYARCSNYVITGHQSLLLAYSIIDMKSNMLNNICSKDSCPYYNECDKDNLNIKHYCPLKGGVPND